MQQQSSASSSRKSGTHPSGEGRTPSPETLQSAIESIKTGTPIEIPNKVYFRIGDVAEMVGVKAYVLRYWETEFPILSPEKSSTGQRLYRKNDVETLLLIKHLLYTEKYSIDGARRRIRELRKEGRFATFKKETVLGGGDREAEARRAAQTRKLAEELMEAASVPVETFFKY